MRRICAASSLECQHCTCVSMLHICVLRQVESAVAEDEHLIMSDLPCVCMQVRRLAAADFRREREEAVAAVTILGAFAKAERSSFLGFMLREPATLDAEAQTAEVAMHYSYLLLYHQALLLNTNMLMHMQQRRQ